MSNSGERFASAYEFELPPELIAQTHAHPRDASRLLVMRPGGLQHARFSQLPAFLRRGDLLVLNDTRVIAARLLGERVPGGGRVELLLLRPADRDRYDERATRWHALAKPGRRMQPGQRVSFGAHGSCLVTGVHEGGIREIELDLALPFADFLEQCGTMPLPPYIHNESDEAQKDYQTIFARNPGSVAAPTASLHFTDAVMRGLDDAGIETARLTLDVGLGTFRPMQSARLDDHLMHAETYDIPPATANAVERAKREGRRVIAAGTTVVRALEGSALANGTVAAGASSTDVFITPGFQFAVIDGMITNFHLPGSTLLVLVSAFAGRERVLAAYRTAVKDRYRFFSFGDAMLVLREPAH